MPLPPALETRLPPWLSSLPGFRQRRRALVLLAFAVLVLLLRPWFPFLFLPGWVVGALLIAAVIALLRWAWWPQRWR